MKKFLLGLLCGIVLAGLVGVIFVFAAIRLSNTRPTVAEGSVMVLKLEGDVPEKPPVEIPLGLFESQAPITVRDLWSTLHRASADSRIKAIVLAPRGLSVGWGKLQEIRESLLAFKKSGKPVYAMLRMPGLREYYISTAADKVYTTPEDYIDLKGLRIEAMFFKNTLDKLGVQMEVEHVGKYKDAFDMFTRTSMSHETRDVYNQLLDQYYGDLASVIASGRKKTPEEARAVIDKGPFVAKDALANGLVDVLGYEDQMFGDLKERLKLNDLKKIGHREYLRALPAEDSRTRIALVVGEGAITSASGNESPFGGNEGITSGGFTRLLRRVKTDDSIKGVIVRIDSPGGDAIASDDILHEMKELSQKKPTVISMSDVAASGGYFMAVTGDPIIAYPNTITGSIGVITARLNLHGLYDKLGIQKDILSRGRFATIDSDYKPLSEAERAKIQDSIESTYNGFVSRVASARHKSYEQVNELAQGRVWLGSQAKQNGLVDELGGLDRAIDLVRQRAKIPAGQHVNLVPYPPKRSLLEVLMNRSDDTNVVELQTRQILKRLPGSDWLSATLKGGVLMLMPYHISVQ
jgi:protease IV